MEQTILSISGKPGLFKLVAAGGRSLVVEAIDETHKRSSVGVQDRVTSLNDVSMYTTGEDIPLKKVLKNIFDKCEGKVAEIKTKTASKKDLEDFMLNVLPEYDQDRVYMNDIRKLINWYNILVQNGITDFEAEAAESGTDEMERKEEK